MEWPMKMTETERLIGMRMEQVMLRRRRWGKTVLAGAVDLAGVGDFALQCLFWKKERGIHNRYSMCFKLS